MYGDPGDACTCMTVSGTTRVDPRSTTAGSTLSVELRTRELAI